MLPHQCFEPVDAVATEVVDGELVLLQLHDGVYFGLDHVGTLVWSWLVSGRSLTQMSAELGLVYPDESPEKLRLDVQALVSELVGANLVQPRNSASTGATEQV